MRILQLHTRYRQRGGEDTVVEAEAALLREAGHEVHQQLATNPAGALKTSAHLLASSWNPLAAASALRAARQGQVDIAHVHNTWFAMSASVISQLHAYGIPVVLTLHNYRVTCANGLLFRNGHPCEECVGRHPFPAVRHRCYHGSLLTSGLAALSVGAHSVLGTWARHVDAFICLSEFAMQRFSRAGLPPARLHVRPPFAPDPGERTGPPSRSDKVLYVGRLEREKGVELLMEAWRLARPSKLELLVLGDGSLRERLEERLPARVRILGHRPRQEVNAQLLSARALVLPSLWYEGMPSILIEAMAAGLPVVVSGLGAMSELAEASDAWATRVAAGDLAAWAGALGSLDPSSPGGRQGKAMDEAGRAGRQLYLALHTPVAGLSSLLRVYEAAMGHHRSACQDRPPLFGQRRRK
ncbi:MAG TPA: glycosyltransferase [Acidimicrobiales bacterium]|nr:glycosyltransferase [Acidimicrobiales bacterium]